MAVTIKDVLKLELFQNSKVLAGNNGLNRVVNRVSVFDCPIEENRDRIVLKEGDFFLTNFFFLKDNLEYALYAMDFLDSCRCSCLCVTSEYVDYFCDELIKHCNKINFPVITIDYTISYGDVIKSISYLIIDHQRNCLAEMQLTNLLNTSNSIQCQKFLTDINPHFLEYITVIYCYSSEPNYKFDTDFINLINQNKTNSCIPYKNGLIIIASYYKSSTNSVESIINYFINIIKNNINKSIIGISNNFMSLINAKEAISQAILCCTSTTLTNNPVVNYNDLGTLSLLFSFKDTDEVKILYKNIIDPIVLYDEKYNKDLLLTLIAFVECAGDFKLTAHKIFQHENTVRYRILKVKSILGLENSNIEFYERISIGVKLHKIYNQI